MLYSDILPWQGKHTIQLLHNNRKCALNKYLKGQFYKEKFLVCFFICLFGWVSLSVCVLGVGHVRVVYCSLLHILQHFEHLPANTVCHLIVISQN